MMCDSATNFFDKWFEQITSEIAFSVQVENVSQKFSGLRTDKERVELVLNLDCVHEVMKIPKPPGKSASLSTRFRNEGNKVYSKGRYSEALKLYNESVVQGPCHRVDKGNSELALAYANRSAVLFHLRYFKLCLLDIENSLCSGYPEELEFKLFDRRGKSLKNLGQKKEALEAFKNAKYTLDKSQLDNKKKTAWAQDIDKNIVECQGDIDSCIGSEDPTFTLPRPPVFIGGTNECYVSLSDAVDVAYTAEKGRHIVAKQIIKPGDLVLIEKPYASVLLPHHYPTHCHHCYKRYMVAVPCFNCSAARFCSISCRQMALATYHQFECACLQIIHNSGVGKFGHLALRTVTMATLQTFLDYREKPNTDKSKLYRADDYDTIYRLVTHDEDRAVHDLFRRSLTAVFLVKCLENSGYFVQNLSGEEHLDAVAYIASLMVSHLQLLPCNAHEISELELHKDDVATSIPLEVGAGIYSTLSLFNHSCDPGVNRNFYGSECVMRAIKTIQVGEEVSDNYGAVYAVQCRRDRLNKLRPQYFFDCACQACEEDWPLYPSIPHDVPVWKCDQCGARLPVSPATDPLVNCVKCGHQQNLKDKQTALTDSQAHYNVAFGQLLTHGDAELALPVLQGHLVVLDQLLWLPWREYNDCQEAVKQCYSILGNCHTVTGS